MKKAFMMSSMLVFVLLYSFPFGKVAKNIVIAKTKAGIFKSTVQEIGESPLCTVSKGEWMEVVSPKDDVFMLYVKVKTKLGVEGWIKKSFVKRPDDKTKKFVMDEAKVLGYLENPQAVYILDFDGSEFKPIRLEYSFKDFIITDVDKENFQRLYDKNLKAEK